MEQALKALTAARTAVLENDRDAELSWVIAAIHSCELSTETEKIVANICEQDWQPTEQRAARYTAVIDCLDD
jgi:hypothetical protein